MIVAIYMQHGIWRFAELPCRKLLVVYSFCHYKHIIWKYRIIFFSLITVQLQVDFVRDHKYQSTGLNIVTCFSRVFHKSPQFHLGHVNAVDSVLTGQYIRIDNGAIQRAFYISFALSLSRSSFYSHIYFPPNRWMHWKFFARSCRRILFYPVWSMLRRILFSIWFNLIALSSKKCQVGLNDWISFNENSRVNIDFSLMRH